MKKLIYAFCLFLIIWWFFLRDTSAPAPKPGIKLPGAPVQTSTSLEKWTEKDYEIRPLARYQISARVLSRKRYFFDPTSDISPLDLALGWGEMSDSGVIAHIGISQSGRWYEYYYPADCPVPPEVIATQSANVHCLPADSEVRSDLLGLRRNSFVELKGFLVEAQKAGADRPWTSSLVRDDQGAGACEIFWVTDVRELSP
jgi:hypothetical protein